jgi:hypothetical protein
MEYKNNFLLLQTILDEVCTNMTPNRSLQSMRVNIETIRGVVDMERILRLYDLVSTYVRKDGALYVLNPTNANCLTPE